MNRRLYAVQSPQSTGGPDGPPVSSHLRQIQRKKAVSGLAEGRGVNKSTVGPQSIQTARDTQRGVHADVALKDFAVVTQLLDDLVSPVVRKAQFRALTSVNAQQAASVGFRLMSSSVSWPIARMVRIDWTSRKVISVGGSSAMISRTYSEGVLFKGFVLCRSTLLRQINHGNSA